MFVLWPWSTYEVFFLRPLIFFLLFHRQIDEKSDPFFTPGVVLSLLFSVLDTHLGSIASHLVWY